MQNVLDASIGSIAWYFIGYGIAQGKGDTPSGIGTTRFFLQNDAFNNDSGYSYASWLFQWAFASTAVTIVSGAVTERCTTTAYLCYSTILTAFIYPVVVHWGWSESGWASAWRETDLLFGCGATDFAGSGVVHMTGATAAFWGIYFLKARENPNPDLPTYCYVFQTLGVLILWFGWYAFNGVSTLTIVGNTGVAAKTMVVTTISAGAGGLSTLFFSALWDRYVSKLDEVLTLKLSAANNGVLAGLVGVTAGCAVVDPIGSLIIGIFAAPVYVISSRTLVKCGFDDVVDAVPVHGCCGFYGVIMAALLATEENYKAAYFPARASKCAGLFYGGDGSMLGANFIMAVAIFFWTSVCSVALFGILSKCKLLRVSKQVEDEGFDTSEHGMPKREETRTADTVESGDEPPLEMVAIRIR